MGGCQNHGLFWGPLNIRCRIILRIQKGAIILATTHVPSQNKEPYLKPHPNKEETDKGPNPGPILRSYGLGVGDGGWAIELLGWSWDLASRLVLALWGLFWLTGACGLDLLSQLIIQMVLVQSSSTASSGDLITYYISSSQPKMMT